MLELLGVAGDFIGGGLSKLFGWIKTLPWYVIALALLAAALVYDAVGWRRADEALTKSQADVKALRDAAKTDAASIKALQGQVTDCNAHVDDFQKAAASAQAAASAVIAKQLPGQQARASAAASLRAAPPPVTDVDAPPAYLSVRNLL